MIKNKILVTGAAGYIGGTFTYEVLKKGFEVHGIDNFINSDRRNIDIFLRDFPSVFGFSKLRSFSNLIESGIVSFINSSTDLTPICFNINFSSRVEIELCLEENSSEL